jgi:hypothetical protein
MSNEDRVTTSGQAAFDAATRRYALGALDDAESLLVEERLVTDPAAFDVLLAVADDLTEDYLDDALGADDRRRFETHFLAIPEHQDRLRVMRALRAKATAAAVPARLSGRTRGLATAAIIAIAASGAVGTWLAVSPAEPTAPAVRSAVPPPMTVPSTVPGPADAGAAAPSGPSRVAGGPAADTARPAAPVLAAATPRTFQLHAGLTRSTGTLPRIAIPGGATSIRLRLDASSPLAEGAYRAAIEDIDGGLIFAALVQRRAADATPFSLTVPADRLVRGDYRLVLTTPDDGGTPQTVATYPFRVTADGQAPPR